MRPWERALTVLLVLLVALPLAYRLAQGPNLSAQGEFRAFLPYAVDSAVSTGEPAPPLVPPAPTATPVASAIAPGAIITVAGTGVAGFSGDGGLAVAAQVNTPFDVAAYGNSIFIADMLNRRVRLVATNGSISTFLNFEECVARPKALRLDSAGFLYLILESSSFNPFCIRAYSLVVKFSPAGE